MALGAAYRDVAAAFDYFLSQNEGRPLILAAHSQGSLHLIRLLHEKVAGTPLASRIVAAYVVGWPISVESDLPALVLPACQKKDQAGCILSWQSFAEPADTASIQTVFAESTGLTGKPRKGKHMLCVSTLNGAPDTKAVASQKLGTVPHNEHMRDTEFIKDAGPARCDKSEEPRARNEGVSTSSSR